MVKQKGIKSNDKIWKKSDFWKRLFKMKLIPTPPFSSFFSLHFLLSYWPSCPVFLMKIHLLLRYRHFSSYQVTSSSTTISQSGSAVCYFVKWLLECIFFHTCSVFHLKPHFILRNLLVVWQMYHFTDHVIPVLHHSAFCPMSMVSNEMLISPDAGWYNETWWVAYQYKQSMTQ